MRPSQGAAETTRPLLNAPSFIRGTPFTQLDFIGSSSMSAVQEAFSNGTAIGGIDAPVLLRAMHALKKGDFSVRLPMEWTGVAGKVADAFNEVIELNERMALELARLGRVVGKEGKITNAPPWAT